MMLYSQDFESGDPMPAVHDTPRTSQGLTPCNSLQSENPKQNGLIVNNKDKSRLILGLNQARFVPGCENAVLFINICNHSGWQPGLKTVKNKQRSINSIRLKLSSDWR
jgi:hypothetical protein